MKARRFADSVRVVNELADRYDRWMGHQGTGAGDCGHATIILTAGGFRFSRLAVVVLVTVMTCVTYSDMIISVVRRMFIQLRDLNRGIGMHCGIDGRKAVPGQ
ncbi:hypothetical protein FB009_12027 [Sinorhizobium medicae]|nr:hypothetical protein FB009_12027 [Sinorhizobium medicae]